MKPALHTVPMARLLTVRLVASALVALVAATALGWALSWRAMQTAGEQQLADARGYVARRVADLEHDWMVRAQAYRGGLELLQVFAALHREDGQARLTALLTSLGGEETFTHVVVDGGGRRVFDYVSRSQQSLPVPAGAGAKAWVWGEADRTLYRAIGYPVLLADGPGRLWLYVPVDNAVLAGMAYPSTQLTLHWQSQAAARSAAGVGAAPDDEPSARAVMRWDDADSAPELLIVRRLAAPISTLELQVLVAGAALATAVLVWLVLGRWTAQHVRRLLALQEAVAAFDAEPSLNGRVRAALAAAQTGASQEMDALVVGLRGMMQSVEQSREALQESKQQLEQRVRERTVELETARDGALAASHAKELFLANMSHELRTPLSGLLGGLDLLRDAPLEPPQRAFLDIARGAGGVLLGIINEVLDYSKIEAGHLQLASQPFSPGELVNEVAQLFHPGAEAKGLVLRVAAPVDGGTRLLGDPMRLRQVLMNLTGNAVKFTHEGHVLLRTAQQRLDDGRWRLHLEVEDTGIGIGPQALSRLFAPFVQVEPNGAAGGTGLGLAISQRLVTAMGGHIDVQTAPGRGSCFRCVITLPEAPAPAAAPGELDPAHSLGATRVLLVEDNPVNRTIGAAMLHACGVDEVIECDRGDEVWSLVDRHRPDLVLMDCHLPAVDGFVATARVRAAEAAAGRTRIPIVATTADVQPSDRDRCLAAGMDDFLPKPYSREQLMEVLLRWLSRHVEA